MLEIKFKQLLIIALQNTTFDAGYLQNFANKFWHIVEKSCKVELFSSKKRLKQSKAIG
jgi:hypothetical protein